MSYAFCLQDLVTIGGPSGSTAVIQAADTYLDLSGFQDVVVWTDVKYVAAGGASPLSLLIETAPIQDELLFEAAPMVNVNTGGSGSTLLQVGTQINKVLLSAATTPLTRWVRWRVVPTTATSAWQLGFRIWLSASTPGMR